MRQPTPMQPEDDLGLNENEVGYMGRFLVGLILGVLLIPAVVYGWFKFGHPPVAVADAPLPFERQITHLPLHARMDSEMVKTAPIQADENNLVAGAQIYRDQCAACHGFHNKPSSFAQYMFPHAPQLWEKHHNGVVGVSDDPPGETFWRVSNGIRLTGMPSYSKVLSETQMWQVTVLLANADKPLPPAALDILNGGQPAAAGDPAPGMAKAK
jgi:thiosulfate dehydrogenase